ncbi:MAG: YraN family protein [Termitinemataceae bacterium]|nr:MAG: YraN family protein [Termitinemataceae bacterium]
MENKKSTHLRGVEGENLAVGFLQKSGYVILGRNYRSFRGEIDIIALDGDVLVFIEVKAWSSYSIENLQYSINKKKCKKIIETAKYFLQNHRKYIESNIRFDVVFVGTPNITHIKAAFTENICQE